MCDCVSMVVHGWYDIDIGESIVYLLYFVGCIANLVLNEQTCSLQLSDSVCYGYAGCGCCQNRAIEKRRAILLGAQQPPPPQKKKNEPGYQLP